jgi:4-amino-4-deoxy-L-arabinose transferase-like glycosyltransferase
MLKIFLQLSREKKYTLFILGSILFFFVLNNFIWLAIDTLPPAWDQAYHMFLASEQHKALATIFDSPESAKNIFRVSYFYPPLFYLTSQPFISVLGFSEDHLIYVNFLYQVLLIMSMYGIGMLLFANRRIAILSSALVCFYPIVFGLSREYYPDFALLALVTCTQFLIIKSFSSSELLWFLLAGISCGFSLLVKPTSIIYLFFPAVLLVPGHLRRKKDAFPLVLFALIVLSVIVLWYLYSFWDLNRVLLERFSGITTLMDKLITKQYVFESLSWYGSLFVYNMLSPNLYSFFCVGLLLFLIFGISRRRIMIILFSWFLFPYLFFCAMPGKDSRYILPILPSVAFITIAGIDALPKRYVSNILYSILGVIACIQFYNLSFNMPPYLVREPADNYFNRYPKREDWKIREIMRALPSYLKNQNNTVGVLPLHPLFHPNVFTLYNSVLYLPYTIKGGDYRDLKRLDTYSYLITKTEDLIDPVREKVYRRTFYEKLQGGGLKKYGFRKILEIPLPDKSSAEVYQNIHLR